MSEKKPGMFAEDNGNISTTRVMSILCTVAGIGIAFYAVFQRYVTAEVVTMVLGLTISAMGSKVLGKKLEK